MGTPIEGHITTNVIDRVVTKERLFGTEKRWRRFGEPTPAGQSVREDGSPDYGIFGPGTVAWEILLHPAMMFFQFLGQGMLQQTYRPITAGVRDVDPISRKARNGTLTAFDVFDRGQRNSGIHAPMWLGDTATAQRVAMHLHNVHNKVAGDLIDIGQPELGGYAANSPREAMWAALTEMHSMLRLYEAFAFRNGKLPHRLPPEKRDQFMAEVAAYCRLVGSPEDEIPTTMAEIAALYAKYDALFEHSETIWIIPEIGQDMREIVAETLKKNFHISQVRVFMQLLIQGIFNLPVAGSLSSKTRRALGMGPIKEKLTLVSKKVMLPLVWAM